MKYFLQGTNERQYTEVSKDEFVDAERLNGFYNTLGKPREPATSGFVGMYHRGHVEFDSVLDFRVPRDQKAMGYALHDAGEGEVAEILVARED